MIKKNNLDKKKETMTTTCYSSSSIVSKYSIRKEIERKELLLNINYINILYLLLNNSFIRFNELLKLKNINWKYYISHLLNLNIIRETQPSQEYKDFLLISKQMNKGNIKQAKFYSLTQEGNILYNNQSTIYYLMVETDDSFINHISEQKLKYEEVQLELLLIEERKKRIADIKLKISEGIL